MIDNYNNKITIFIPTFNNSTTILDTLRSIEDQKTEKIEEIIIIDDQSKDDTLSKISKFMKTSRYKYKVIKNKKRAGLAHNYNSAIKITKTELLIIMHADIEIINEDAIHNYYKIMQNRNNVASISKMVHNIGDWEKFTFWEKCEFDRQLSFQRYFLAAKFDIFRVSTLRKIGYFNADKYYAGGEDSDIWIRLKAVGKIINSKNAFIHKQSFSKNYYLFTLLYRNARYAEASGVLFRNHFGEYNFFEYISLYFREIMTICLVISMLIYFTLKIQAFILLMLIVFLTYSLVYTKNTLLKSGLNPKIFLLPFINILLIFISNFFVLRGFVRNKEVL